MITQNSNGGLLMKRIQPISIEANSQRTGYEIPFAINPNPSLIYNSLVQTADIKLIFAQNLPLSHAVTLVNHNLPVSAVVNLKYYSDAGFTTLIGTVPMTVSEKNMYRIVTASDIAATGKYLKISIDSKRDNFFIGVIFPSGVFQFPHNFSWGYEDEFVVEKEVEVSDYGYPIETPDDDDNWSAPEYHRIRISFDDVDRTYHNQFLQVIRPGKKVFFPSTSKGECFYGIVPDKVLKAKKNQTGDTYSVSFQEAAVGESQ